MHYASNSVVVHESQVIRHVDEQQTGGTGVNRWNCTPYNAVVSTLQLGKHFALKSVAVHVHQVIKQEQTFIGSTALTQRCCQPT